MEGSYKIEAGSIQFCAYNKVHRFLCKFESGGPSFKFCAQSSLLCIRVVSPIAGSRWSSTTTTTPTTGGQAGEAGVVFGSRNSRWWWSGLCKVAFACWVSRHVTRRVSNRQKSIVSVFTASGYCKVFPQKWVMQGVCSKLGTANGYKWSSSSNNFWKQPRSKGSRRCIWWWLKNTNSAGCASGLPPLWVI